MAAFIEPELVARYQTNSLNINWQSAFEATFGRTKSLEEDIRDALEFKKDDISVAEYCDKVDKMVDQIMRHKPDRKAIWKMVVAASLNNSDMKKEFLTKKPPDSTGNAKYFSTIDLGNAYYQVELDESSKLKTAFSTRTQQYCFNRMPFGIAAAPVTFQRLMNRVLGKLNWKIAIVYLDDIIIYSNDITKHYENLKLVFDQIKASGLKIKLSKCTFLKQEVKFLGHILTKDGLMTDPDKTKTIQEMQVPKCIK